MPLDEQIFMNMESHTVVSSGQLTDLKKICGEIISPNSSKDSSVKLNNEHLVPLKQSTITKKFSNLPVHCTQEL